MVALGAAGYWAWKTRTDTRASLLLGAEPIPGLDLPVLLVMQARMVLRLGAIYGENITGRYARELVTAAAGGLAARYIGEELAKFLPGPGWVISAGFAAAGTYAIGQVAREYFESGRHMPVNELRGRYEQIVAERRHKKN